MTFFGLSYSTFGGDLYGSLCGNENNILICLPFVFGKNKSTVSRDSIRCQNTDLYRI